MEDVGQRAQAAAGIRHPHVSDPFPGLGQGAAVQHGGGPPLEGLADVAVPVRVQPFQGREQPAGLNLPGIVGQAEDGRVAGGVELQDVQVADQLAQSHAAGFLRRW